tara:strand:- start:1573 stop:1761 length:189 start_codon:yes stop_codon:yes gene_type:complete
VNIEVIEMSECECGCKKTNEVYARLVTGQVDGPDEGHVLTVCAACKVVLTAEKVDKKPTQEE